MMRLLVAFSIFISPLLSVAQMTDFTRQELSYVNVLAPFNGGFESGTAKWTASGGTFAAVTSGSNLLEGKGSVTWNSSSASQTLVSQAVTVKNGYFGRDCEASITAQVPSGTATHTFQAWDGTNPLAYATIETSTLPRKNTLTFPCPSSGTFALRLLSVASDEPLIALDEGYLGLARNVGKVAQVLYKGSISMTGCTDWSRSNTAFGDFTATAGCTYTVTGDVLAPSTFIPGFRLQNVAPGRYFIIGRGYFGKSVTTTNADISFRFSDGTSTFAEQIATSAASASGQATGVGEITGSIGYTSAQSTLTFQVQGQTSSTATSTAAVISDDGGANATSEITGLQFEVFYFPTSQQTVVMPDAQGWFAAGEITGANPTLGTSAVTSPTEITNGSLTLTPSSGSAPVGIACATGTTSVVGTYTCGVNESLGFITNVPRSGAHEVCMAYTISGATGNTVVLQVSKTPANSSTPDTNGEQRTSFYNSSTTVAVGSTHRNCSTFNLSAGSNTFRLSYEQDAATNAPGIIADGNTSLGQRNFSFSIKPISGQQQAVLANSVIARDAVGGQVTTINTIVSKTTTYTATANDETIEMSASGGAWTLSLPPAASVKGKIYYLNINAASANAVTINPDGSETICGQTTVAMLGNDDEMAIQSNGTNWIGLNQSCRRRDTARVVCSSSSSITSQSTQWLSSIGNVSAGRCNLTIQTGICSSAPHLTAYHAATGGNNWVIWSSAVTTTTAADIHGFTAAGSALTSFTGDLTLSCPR